MHAATLAVAVLLVTSGSPAGAQDAQRDPDAGDASPAGHGYPVGALSSGPEDPENLLSGIEQRRRQREAIVSPTCVRTTGI